MNAENLKYLYDFVSYLEDRINKDGLLGDYHSEEERKSDVLETIWDAYIKFKDSKRGS